MKVALVYYNGDFLTVAKDYKTAVQFLIDNNYIAGDNKVRPPVIIEGMSNTYYLEGRVDEIVGENWMNIMINQWTPYDFNAFYNYLFEIIEEKVYEQI